MSEHASAEQASAADELAHVKHEVRNYLLVFGSLLVLTIVTVGVSRLNLPRAAAIIVALIIASVKGSLVAGVFMHLFSERVPVIMRVLMFAAVFFVVMVLLIALGFFDTYAVDGGAALDGAAAPYGAAAVEATGAS